jgi:hypothetical protein
MIENHFVAQAVELLQQHSDGPFTRGECWVALMAVSLKVRPAGVEFTAEGFRDELLEFILALRQHPEHSLHA